MHLFKIKYLYLIIISFFSILTFYFSYKLFFSDFEQEEIFFRYLIFSLILIIYFISYFFLNQNLKKYFNIIFYTTVIFLLIAESTIFYLKLDQKKNKKTLIDLYKELNMNGLYLNYFPSTQLFNKEDKLYLSGVSNKKVLTCYEFDEYQIILNDRYGFNNKDEVWDKKIKKNIFVGDSFTQGHCVKNEYNLLSSFFKNNESSGGNSTINLGKGGAGPLISLATLIEYLPDDTENIFYVFNEQNDLDDILNESNNEILMKYLNDRNFKQNLKVKQNLIDETILKDQKKVNIKKKLYEKKMSYINIFYFTNLKRIVIDDLIKINYNFKLLEKFLKELTYLVEIKKIKNVYFVYLPSQKRIVEKNYFFKRKYKKVLNLLDNYNFKLIDLTNYLYKLSEDNNPWQDLAHFDKKSYSLISSEIYKQFNSLD